MVTDATYEFSPLELVYHQDHETLLNDRFAQLLRALEDSLASEKEAVLEDFLISGAMPRDLGTEEGPITSQMDQTFRSHRLTIYQHWRVK